MWVFALGLATAVALLFGWRRSGQSLIDYLGLGLVYLYARLLHRWTSNGEVPVPARGPAILVANHTCSADPAFLTAGCRRRLCFILAREYYKIPGLKQFFEFLHCVPVTRNGRDARAARESLQRLAEGRVVCIFPEGGLANAGTRRMRHGKSGVALLALRSRAPVYPALILDGPQTNNLKRAWLGPSRVHVIFGEALDLSPYLDRNIDRPLLEVVTQFIMKSIASLADVPNSRTGIRKRIHQPQRLGA